MSQSVVFISYSHRDEVEKDELVAHLGVLKHAGLIETWSDDQINAGSNWEGSILEAIKHARVAIMLITANFLNSEFILQAEVPQLLQRRQQEGLVIVPVLARACAWRAVDWLRELQVFPHTGVPVWSSGGSFVDENLSEIAEYIVSVVDVNALPPARGTQRARSYSSSSFETQPARSRSNSAIQTQPLRSRSNSASTMQTQPLRSRSNSAMSTQPLSGPGHSNTALQTQLASSNIDTTTKPSAPVRSVPVRPWRVLAVDDEPSWQKRLSRILREINCNVVIANSYDDAVNALRETSFDLITIDLNLDKSTSYADGLELMPRIRELLGTQLPVIVITGTGGLDEQRRAFKEYNVFDFIQKAKLDFEEFQDVVIEAIGSVQGSMGGHPRQDSGLLFS